MTARLILVCHASTDAVRKSAFPMDEALEVRGQIDAAALAKNLPKADRHWTSPELRARQTAEALQLNAVVVSTLCDCNYGTWRGFAFDEVLARDPEAVSNWFNDPAAAPHGGESLVSLTRRVGEWLSVEKTMNRKSIVVTHAAIIRAAIIHAIDAAPKSFWRIDIAPLSITHLSGTKDRWNLASLGCKNFGALDG